MIEEYYKNRKKLGFTVIELIVTVSIVSIIMAVILFGYSSFNDGLTISSAEQEFSLAVRQAQTYGLSVKEDSSGSNDFTKGYGVSFGMDHPDYYYVFVDRNNNGINDNTGECIGECVEKIPLRNQVNITSVCLALLITDNFTCLNTSNLSMHITFVRPNLDAQIHISIGGTVVNALYERGQVKFTSFKGKTGTVTIEKTGQIYVQ